MSRTTSADSVAPSHEAGRWWSRLGRRLATSAVSVEADELRSAAQRMGCVRIDQAPIAVPVRIFGTIRTLTLRSRAQVPALEVDLYDGTETVTLVFLGRRAIGGITPGRGMLARGRVTRLGSRLVMYNPTYELLPTA